MMMLPFGGSRGPRVMAPWYSGANELRRPLRPDTKSRTRRPRLLRRQRAESSASPVPVQGSPDSGAGERDSTTPASWHLLCSNVIETERLGRLTCQVRKRKTERSLVAAVANAVVRRPRSTWAGRSTARTRAPRATRPPALADTPAATRSRPSATARSKGGTSAPFSPSPPAGQQRAAECKPFRPMGNSFQAVLVDGDPSSVTNRTR